MSDSRVERILKYIDENKDYLFESLARLIRINTENDRVNAHESRLTSVLGEELEAFGAECRLYTPDSVEGILEHPDYKHGKCFDGRENLTAKIRGNGKGGSIMLCAHADTVPVGDLSLWTVPPFSGILRDGKIWGRGACDDKYAIAAMLMIAKALFELDITLDYDLYFTAYVDEEFGGGNGALAAALAYPCDFYYNLDCKNLDIWNCAAGGQRVAVKLRHTHPQHSCHLLIEGLFLLKREIDAFGERRIKELSENERFNDSIIPSTAIRYMSMDTGTAGNDRDRGVLDFAFYTDKTKEEIWTELGEALDRARERIAPLGLIIDSVIERSRFFGYGYVDGRAPEVELIRTAGREAIGKKIEAKASCLSDLSLFLAAAPGRAVSFGAGRDFDAPGGAHLPDEFIECDSLVDFTKTVATLVVKRNGNS